KGVPGRVSPEKTRRGDVSTGHARDLRSHFRTEAPRRRGYARARARSRSHPACATPGAHDGGDRIAPERPSVSARGPRSRCRTAHVVRPLCRRPGPADRFGTWEVVPGAETVTGHHALLGAERLRNFLNHLPKVVKEVP